MLCVVQRTWHDGVKQRAATASYASLGEIEITQTQAVTLPGALTVRKI